MRYLLFTIIVFAGQFLFGQANFTVSKTEGCVGNMNGIQFQADPADSYSWDFGDGNIASKADPTNSFGDAGTYTVTLTVTNGGNQSTATETITVHSLPTAQIVDAPDSNLMGCTPLTVDLEGAGVSTNGSAIATYEWNYGDLTGDAPSASATTSHTYTSAGEWDVTLIVTDAFGCSGSVRNTGYVISSLRPRFSPTQTVGLAACDTPYTLTFNNTAISNAGNGNNDIMYSWTFHDNQTSTEAKPSFTYNDFGTFPVSVTITDTTGCSFTRDEDVVIGSPTAGIIVEDTVCSNAPFDVGNSSLNASRYRWTMGGGSPSAYFKTNTDSFLHTYPLPGTYTMQLVAESGACRDTVTQDVVVIGVDPKIDLVEDTACNYPFPLAFTTDSAIGLAGGSFFWTLPDGTIDSLHDMKDTLRYVERNIYDKEIQDSYTLSLTIENYNCTRSYDTLIVVRRPIAEIRFRQEDPGYYQGCAPLTVAMEDTSERADHHFHNFHWDFDDGSNLDTKDTSLTHTFTNPGEYSVTMHLEDSLGCRDTSYPIIVRVGATANPDFTIVEGAKPNVCFGDSLHIVNTTPATDSVDFWEVFLGANFYEKRRSGDTSVVVITATPTGDDSITLYTQHHGCVSDTTKIGYHVDGAYVAFNPTFDCSAPLAYSFDSTIIEDAASFTWSFGDGNNNTVDQDASHTYATSGVYTVSLTAVSSTACPDYTVEKTVYAMDVTASLTLDTTGNNQVWGDTLLLCSGDDANFSANGSTNYIGGQHKTAVEAADTLYGFGTCYNNYAFFYEWGDGSPALFSTDSNLAHTFDLDGEFTFNLYVKGVNGCFDTASAYIISSAITSHLTTDVVAGCIPFDVTVGDTSTSDTTITHWDFDFGNGTQFETNDSTATTNVVSFTDSTAASFTISLVVTDSIGCVDTSTVEIVPYKPNSNFLATSSQNICAGDSVSFEYTGTTQSSDRASYNWTFNDSTYVGDSADSVFTMVFDTGGIFDVKLTVVDINGCTHSFTRDNSVSVDDIPVAVIYVVDSATTFCYGEDKQVIFRDSSINDNPHSVSNLQWTIETETGTVISTMDTIQPVWAAKGEYDISLLSRTVNGCTHDTTVTISFIGPFGGLVVDNADPICRGDSITFSLSSDTSDIGLMILNYGDGFEDSLYADDFPVTHTYNDVNKAGFFNATLFMFDPTGTCLMDTVENPEVYAVVADFLVNDTNAVNDTLVVCANEPVVITNTSSNLADIYAWDLKNGFTSTQATPTISINGLYPVIGIHEFSLAVESSEFGCVDTMLQSVNIVPVPDLQISVDDDTICAESSTFIDVRGGISYDFNPIELYNNVTNPVAATHEDSAVVVEFAPTETSVTYITGITSDNCRVTDSAEVVVLLPPSDLTHAEVINIGDTVKHRVYAGENYSYVFSGGITGEIIWLENDSVWIQPSGPIAPPPTPDGKISHYFVRAFNQCYDETFPIDITVEPNYTVAMPEAFTPGNPDGNNDKIYVKGWGIKELQEFSVYNRWGELLFTTDDLAESWDGTFKGQVQPVDSYVYVVRTIQYNGDEETRTGSFLIVK